jgi:peroxiredoxin
MKPVRPVAVAAVALAIGVGAYLTFQTLSNPDTTPRVAYTLLDGTTASTDQWHGKVVLVNFWATTCSTCVHEMPQIVATYEKFKGRGFQTLAVSMDYDAPASVIHFAETRKLSFGVAIDSTGSIAKGFGAVVVTPTSVLIDKHGRIVKRFVGEPDFAKLHDLVEKLLSEA